MPSVWSHIPLCSPQEELKQPAPTQEDEAAKVEEEAAEEVGARLPSYIRGPWASLPPEKVSGRDLILHRQAASLLGSQSPQGKLLSLSARSPHE